MPDDFDVSFTLTRWSYESTAEVEDTKLPNAARDETFGCCTLHVDGQTLTT